MNKTRIRLLGVGERRDTLWRSRQEFPRRPAFILKWQVTWQDLSVRVVKLMRKGPNWNPSYLTDNTWRTRCQQLFFFFFSFVKLEKYFCQGKPGATVKHLRRPSTSNVSKQAPSLKKKKKNNIKTQHTALNTVAMTPSLFIDTFRLRFPWFQVRNGA